MLLPVCLPVQERIESKEQREEQVRMINKYAAYDGPSPKVNVIATMNAEEERGQHTAEIKV